LPIIAQRLLEVVDDDRSSANDLTEIILTDQALTAKVLRLVNSSFYGFSRKISTLSKAVVIIGFAAIKNMAISFCTVEAIKKLKGPVDWERYWEHGITCASAGKFLCQALKDPVPEKAFVIGLLHDVGYAIICATHPKEFEEFIDKGYYTSIVEEKEFFGISHPEVGRMLMEHWRFPEDICRVVRHHHTPSMIEKAEDIQLPVLVMANAYSYINDASYYDPFCSEMLSGALSAISLSSTQYSGVFKDVAEHVKMTKDFFGLSFNSEETVSRSDDLRVSFISSDTKRSEWVGAIIESWGMTPVLVSSFKPIIAHEQDISLVILDAAALSGEPMLLLARKLSSEGINVCISESSSETHMADIGLPVIPYLFKCEDVKKQIKSFSQ